MKKFNQWLLIAIIGLGACSKEVCPNTMTLDDLIHKCAEKHMNNIENLTVSNLLSNKAKIEALCKEISTILKSYSNHPFWNNNHTELRKALEANNITHLKQIISQLPEQTKAIVLAKIKDDRIKNFLGL